MAILKIKIERGKFTSHNDVGVQKFTNDKVLGNGWKCWLKKNGAISCISTREYSGTKYELTFKIFKNGEMLLTKKIGEKKTQTLKRVFLEVWPADGIISLPSDFYNEQKTNFTYVSKSWFLE